MIKETDKVVSIKLKSQLGFNLLELIVILAVIAIIAAIAVPKYFNFTDKTVSVILIKPILQRFETTKLPS